MIRNRFVRWTLAASALLLVAALLAGLVWGPSLLSPKQARELVATGAERLGLTLRIAGPVRLTLLPRPALVAGAVTLTGPGGLSGYAGQLTADLSFGPLLRGRFAPRDVNLRDAVLDVPPQVALASAPNSPATLRLLDARVTLGQLALDHVDADVTLSGGRLRVGGSASWRGQRWRLDGTRDPPAADGASAVDVTLAGQGAQAGIGIVVGVRVASDGAVAGHASAQGPDLSAILSGPAVAFAAEGRITGDATLLIADTLGVTLAGQPLQGSVAVRLRPALRADVTLTGARFDLRPWLDHPPSAAAGMPVGVDLSAEAVPIPGGVARGVRLVADLDARGPAWRELAGTLPGEAQVRYLRREPAGTGPFDGHATASLPDPRATLAWARRSGLLPADLAALPDPGFASASFAADVTVAAGTTRLERLTGMIGDMRVAGRLTATRADGAWPLEASLTMEPVAIPAAWPVALSLCSGRSISLDAAVARGAFGAMPLHDGHARLRCEPAGGTLVLDGTLNGGMDARLTAGVAPDGSPRALDLSLIAPRSAMADAFLPDWVAVVLRRLELGDRPGWLRMRADAVDAPWELSARAGPLAVAGTALGTAETWSGTVHVQADALTELRLPPALAAWVGAGPLALAGDVAATPTGARISAGSFTAGTVAGRIDGIADAGHLGGRLVLEAAPFPTALPAIGELDGWTGDVDLRAGRMGALSGLSASAHLDGLALTLRDIAARVGEGTLTGELAATVTDPPRLSITLTGHDLPLDGVAMAGLALRGSIGGSARLTATGTTFGQFAQSLSGTVEAAIAGGSLDGGDLAALGQAIERGGRPVAMPAGVTGRLAGPLKLSAAGGLVAIEAASLDGPAGRIDPSGVFDLAAGTLDLRLGVTPRLAGPRADPTLTWRIAGPLANPAATLDPAGLDLWRATPP